MYSISTKLSFKYYKTRLKIYSKSKNNNYYNLDTMPDLILILNSLGCISPKLINFVTILSIQIIALPLASKAQKKEIEMQE